MQMFNIKEANWTHFSLKYTWLSETEGTSTEEALSFCFKDNELTSACLQQNISTKHSGFWVWNHMLILDMNFKGKKIFVQKYRQVTLKYRTNFASFHFSLFSVNLCSLRKFNFIFATMTEWQQEKLIK